MSGSGMGQNHSDARLRVTVSKSIPPSPDAEVPSRDRLAKLLGRVRRCRFTFVSAPEGYGKTTMLTQWSASLREESAVVAWFTVDYHDADERRFWINFRYSLLTALGENLGDCDDSGVFDDDRRLALANRLSLAARDKGGIFVIVDGFDLIDGCETQREFLAFALAVSSDVHIVMSSRYAYTKHSFESIAIPDAPMYVTVRDFALSEREFRDEIGAYVRGDTASEASLAELYRKAGGWPFAVNLVRDLLADGCDCNLACERLSCADVRLEEFFRYEVFDSLPELDRDFLVRTAFMALISPESASYVLDMDDTRDVISDLLFRNAFIRPLALPRESYQLHPLFSEWLLSRALLLPSSQRRLLNMRAARWCLKHDSPVAAAKHKILASEREDIVNLVLAAFPGMSSKEVIDSAMFDVPPCVEDTTPCFRLLAAWAYAYAVELDELRFWSGLLDLVPAGDMDVGFALSLKVLQVKELCLESRFQEGIKRAQSVEPHLRGSTLLPLRAMLTNCYAEALDQEGDLAACMEMHRSFDSLMGNHMLAFLSAINRYEIAILLTDCGEFGEAAKVCRALELSAPKDYAVRSAAEALHATLDFLQGEEDGIEHRLADAEAHVPKNVNADMYLDCCVMHAVFERVRGAETESDKALLAAINYVRYSVRYIPRGRAVLPFEFRALFKLIDGDVDEAQAVLRQFDQTGAQDTASSRIVRTLVEVVASGGEVAQRLDELAAQADEKKFAALAVDITVHRAMVLFEDGAKAKALRSLQHSLDIAVPWRFEAPFLWRARRIRPLLTFYLTMAHPDYRQRAFVRNLFRSSSFASGSKEGDDVLSVVPLTGREREIVSLVATGLSRVEISHELCLQESTVKSHLSHIYRKFDVRRYSELVAVIAELGMRPSSPEDETSPSA